MERRLSCCSFKHSAINSLATFLQLRVRAPFAGVRKTRQLVYPPVRCHNKLGKFSQTSFVDQVIYTTTVAHRARLGPRVSPRGQTLAEPYTPRLGIPVGASGLRVLDGLKHRLSTFVRKISVSVTESQTVKEAQISSRTKVPFPSGCSPLVRI